jgi:hypothetical protein
MTHHSHDHNIQNELSFDEKIIKILTHWIKHNEEHAASYRNWAEKAKDSNMARVETLLKECAEMTLNISEKFEEAAKSVIEHKK